MKGDGLYCNDLNADGTCPEVKFGHNIVARLELTHCRTNLDNLPSDVSSCFQLFARFVANYIWSIPLRRTTWIARALQEVKWTSTCSDMNEGTKIPGINGNLGRNGRKNPFWIHISPWFMLAALTLTSTSSFFSEGIGTCTYWSKRSELQHKYF